ncbi:chemotaxis protein [Candidatus Poribacteria bacterium]|nr:chemotaxis protein [Candidatus Poribacteria bacterium]
MYTSIRRRRSNSSDYWPGFVDVLSSLLLVLIFLLVVYMLAQYFLQRTVTGQSEALAELNKQVTELAQMLSLERQTNRDLGVILSELSTDLENTTNERNQLLLDLDKAILERDNVTLQLQRFRSESAMKAEELTEEIEIGNDKVRVLLSDLERLKRDIIALNAVRKDLELQVSNLASSVKSQEIEMQMLQESLTSERDLKKELQSKLDTSVERTSLAQKTLESRNIELRELQTLYMNTKSALESEKELSLQQQEQVSLLNQQIMILRQQLKKIETALEISEQLSAEQEIIIADLGKRLNLALAAKVEELAQYRSEFFGKLRDVLGNSRDFSIIGDRFVFKSEVLFKSGEAKLNIAGEKRLETFATILKEVIPQIPDNLPWILQVDGHTDNRPIRTAQFPSNWELSSARAISVVNFLSSLGIPPHRLSATGYGEFQPIDERNDEIGHRRNRRIELKLTQR